MKIKKTIEKTEEIDIDLETPAYFKSGRDYAAIYSEDSIIKINVGSHGFRIVQAMRFEDMYKPEEIFTDGEQITAEHFNEVLRDALYLIQRNALPEPLSVAV